MTKKDRVMPMAAEELRLPMDGTYMNVIRFGHGSRPLVMLSGVSLTGLEGAGDGVAAAYAAFSDDCTVYLFDRKKVLPAGYRVQDMAEDVYRALQALGVQEADVYGVSQGGMMALCLALAHPAAVQSLVLCSTAAKAGERLLSAVRQWKLLAEKHDVRGLNRAFTAMVYSPDWQERYREAFLALEGNGTEADCDRFAILCGACAAFDVSDRLPEIRCPALVLADDTDQVIDSGSGLALADALQADRQLYHGFGHAVYDEAPDIKARILSFLNRDRQNKA